MGSQLPWVVAHHMTSGFSGQSRFPVLVMLSQASDYLGCGRGEPRARKTPGPSRPPAAQCGIGLVSLAGQFSKGSLGLAEGEAAGLAFLR